MLPISPHKPIRLRLTLAEFEDRMWRVVPTLPYACYVKQRLQDVDFDRALGGPMRARLMLLWQGERTTEAVREFRSIVSCAAEKALRDAMPRDARQVAGLAVWRNNCVRGARSWFEWQASACPNEPFCSR